MYYKCINLKNGESASIELKEIDEYKLYKLYYYDAKHSPRIINTSYREIFNTLRGAKMFLSRYLGFKTKWKEIKDI